MTKIHCHLGHPDSGHTAIGFAPHLRMQIADILPVSLSESKSANSQQVRSERKALARLEDENSERLNRLARRLVIQLVVWRDDDPGTLVDGYSIMLPLPPSNATIAGLFMKAGGDEDTSDTGSQRTLAEHKEYAAVILDHAMT